MLDANFWQDRAKSKKIVMAICTNKQERLANDLLIKLDLMKYFDFVAGSDTFDFNKPDARHLTNVVEILEGNQKIVGVSLVKLSVVLRNPLLAIPVIIARIK